MRTLLRSKKTRGNRPQQTNNYNFERREERHSTPEEIQFRQEIQRLDYQECGGGRRVIRKCIGGD